VTITRGLDKEKNPNCVLKTIGPTNQKRKSASPSTTNVKCSKAMMSCRSFLTGAKDNKDLINEATRLNGLNTRQSPEFQWFDPGWRGEFSSFVCLLEKNMTKNRRRSKREHVRVRERK
jgi:hypothetical protein